MSDTDFEQGSLAAANAIFAWIGSVYGPTMQRAAIVAWNAGDMWAPAEAAPAVVTVEPDPTLLHGGPKLTRDQARDSGYTGDQCTQCYSLRMKRNGSCLVCEDCQTTTGCS